MTWCLNWGERYILLLTQAEEMIKSDTISEQKAFNVKVGARKPRSLTKFKEEEKQISVLS